MMMMKCFDDDFDEDEDKTDNVVYDDVRYGADSDGYDNLNDDNIDYFVCVILSFSRSGTKNIMPEEENNQSLSYSEMIL